jgi:hypothetical protein
MCQFKINLNVLKQYCYLSLLNINNNVPEIKKGFFYVMPICGSEDGLLYSIP